METKLQLHGFNNLTKSLSFNIYDICYAQTEEQREAYIDYIDEMYNAERLTQILTDVVKIIGANVLNIARQDYEPHGASVTMLIAEHELRSRSLKCKTTVPLSRHPTGRTRSAFIWTKLISRSSISWRSGLTLIRQI